MNKNKKVAVLPKGYDVEVLIEKDGWLMIKTPFGLTGWVNERDLITYDVTGEKLSIKGLYYMGD
ncbi:MAG: SH3 domain-containing protein [Bacteroidales bacterium]|nr:SH3 domain-containing protein [Bacteroidales bacterium]